MISNSLALPASHTKPMHPLHEFCTARNRRQRCFDGPYADRLNSMKRTGTRTARLSLEYMTSESISSPSVILA